MTFLDFLLLILFFVMVSVLIQEDLVLLLLLLLVMLSQPLVLPHRQAFFGCHQLLLLQFAVQTLFEDGCFHVVVGLDEEWLVEVALQRIYDLQG